MEGNHFSDEQNSKASKTNNKSIIAGNIMLIVVVALLLFFVVCMGRGCSGCSFESSRDRYERDLNNGLEKAANGESLSDSEQNAVDNFMEYILE